MRILMTLLLTTLYCGYAIATNNTPSTAFTLTTDAFLDTGALPVLYTCDGSDVSPALAWNNVPANTKALALVMTDPDAPGGTFYHWILYNIPTTVKQLVQNSSQPAGVDIGKNSFDKLGYNGPCPPKGSTHTYVLTLYALDNKIDVPAHATGDTVDAVIAKHTVGKTTLTVVYSRWLQ